MLLALAAQFRNKLRHIDIMGAFLNGDVDQQVSMKQPESYVKQGKETSFLNCIGLKQAGVV
jgi:hypothetical protein